FGAAVKFLIVGAGVAGKALHLNPEKEWPSSGADPFECFRGSVINLLHILSFDLAPVGRLENLKRERIVLTRRHADAVAVVFNEEKHGKHFLPGETESFKEIPLARRGVANCSHHKVFLAV